MIDWLTMLCHPLQVTATEALGLAFQSEGLQILGFVLAVCIIIVWVFVFSSMIRCLWRREL